MSAACVDRFSDRRCSGHAMLSGESRSPSAVPGALSGESRSFNEGRLKGRRPLPGAARVPWRHTALAIGWSPLGGGVVVALAVGAVVGLSGSPTAPLLALTAATVAAGALAGLHDPASALLSAVPASAARRRLHRLALVVPVSTVAWVGLLLAAQLDDGWSAGWPIGPLLALIVAGVAVATWASPGWAVPAAVAVPMAWAVLDRLVGQSDDVAGTGLGDWAFSAWLVHPWVVVLVAGIAVAAGWRR